MTHDDLVFQALAYRRYTGASLGDIRSYLGVRETTKGTSKADLAVLERLEEAGDLIKVGKRWYFTPQGEKRAKGRAYEPEWEREDAWVLLAMLARRGRGQISLADIIATGDGINHAIFTREALHGALNRLLAGGLIATKGDGYAVTKKAVGLHARLKAACGKSALAQLEGLGRMLDCPCCGVKLKAVRWRVTLDEPTYKRAYKEYSDSWRG